MGELTHHGVMGMKWGVRRYQNEDGSLTPKGKARFKQVRDNKKLAVKQKKQAEKIIKNNLFVYKPDRNAKYYKNKAEKAKTKGNVDKYQRLIDKSQSYIRMSNVLNKKLSDISSDTIKAGRDYIVQKDYDIGVNPLYSYFRVTSTLIEKRR